MKKVWSILSVLVVTALVLAGCGTNAAQNQSKGGNAAPKKTPKVAFICKDLSQQWFIGTSNAMKKAVEARGGKFFALDCAMSPDKYMTNLDNVISQKVDVLIVCPPDQKLSQATVQRCQAAGIKVMADDDGLIDANGHHIAPALELDAYKVGQSQGDWLGNYVIAHKSDAEPASTALLVLTVPTVSSIVPRSQGAIDEFKKKVPDFPASKIIQSPYDGTSDKAFNVAAATITAHPEIKTWLVVAPNDEGAQGATRALEQAGKDKQATVVGLGAYLAKDEFKKPYSAFKAAAYLNESEDGTIAGNAAMDWIQKGLVPYAKYKKPGSKFGVYPFGAEMVDRSNYKQIMGADAN
ncbi:Periplasmic binding protein domain [Acididesulfobacillus acetoxydans]|uniref:Periplasmic binding protein domain n=1 Tax=Acididesulfobacillus acetoxydans TaxID=1561005 RepID=A0A8S0WFV9_9FIRM|nr:substrate-binding domain-containing protein [Acididesulfobacillus acetoxydans]CAA7601392.1 Periplasmic binding protein domain [Acididesulfobacillus acetoxydans]CEJ08823.1 Periplasmic binding protein/LacI transcriptional regulator [Acididesulfobacillus acetoxydans]